MQVCPRTRPNALTGVGSPPNTRTSLLKTLPYRFQLDAIQGLPLQGLVAKASFATVAQVNMPAMPRGCGRKQSSGAPAAVPPAFQAFSLGHSGSDRAKRMSHGHGKRSCSRCASRPHAGSSQLSQGAPQAGQMTQPMHASAAAHRRQARARPPQGAAAVATPLHPEASAPPAAAAAPPPWPLPRGRPQRLLLRRNLRPRQPRDCTPLWRVGPRPRRAAARCHQSSPSAAWRRDHAVQTPAPARRWRRERLTRWRGGRQGCPAHP